VGGEEKEERKCGILANRRMIFGVSNAEKDGGAVRYDTKARLKRQSHVVHAFSVKAAGAARSYGPPATDSMAWTSP
jgi:hypothetical protein